MRDSCAENALSHGATYFALEKHGSAHNLFQFQSITNKRCLIKTENPPLPLPESVLGENVGNCSDHKTDNASIFNFLNLFVLSHRGEPIIPAYHLSDITSGDSYLPLQTQPPLKASASTS